MASEDAKENTKIQIEESKINKEISHQLEEMVESVADAEFTEVSEEPHTYGCEAPTTSGSEAPPRYGCKAPPTSCSEAPSASGSEAPPTCWNEAPPNSGSEAPLTYGSEAPPIPPLTGKSQGNAINRSELGTGAEAVAQKQCQQPNSSQSLSEICKEATVSATPSSTATKTVSFRRTDTSLASIRQLSPVKQGSFNLRKWSTRFCYHKNIFYFPSRHEQGIDCFSQEGEFLKSINVDEHGVDIPVSVHPLTEDSLLVASCSGLYELGIGEGGTCQRIMQGCADVHVSEGVVAVLLKGKKDKKGEKGECDTIQILSAKYLSSVVCTITLAHCHANTVLLYQGSLYVSSGEAYNCDNQHISMYCLSTGELTSQYGSYGHGTQVAGELHNPFLSVWDTEGGLLVVERYGRRLQMLSAGGEWAVIPVLGKLGNRGLACDAVIVGDHLLVLYLNRRVQAYEITYN